MKNDLLEKIKGRGYWRINFQPTTLQHLTQEQCTELIKRNAVKLRGWDLPHFPQRQGEDTGLDYSQNYCQGWIDWWAHKEFWRMYKSGQYLHYLALHEDWYEEDGMFSHLAEIIKPMTTLNVIGAVEYQVSEIFEFLSRMMNEGIYDEGVNVSITLKNLKGRILRIDDERRVPLHTERRTDMDEFVFQERFIKQDVIGNVGQLSKKMCLDIFASFGWLNPHLSSIEDDITKFLAGRRS